MKMIRPAALVALFGLATCNSVAVNSVRDHERPNIVFIFSDDHSTAAISAYGSRINQTPNLDRIAAEGMLFENTFCTNSICAPSRAVILTGKHSHLNSVPTNAERFDGSQTTFPKLLQAADYQTALVGKWHLKSDPTGFDFWRVLPGQGEYYSPEFLTPDGRKKYEGYCTDITTDFGLEWLDGREEDKPFCLMLQHKAPHRSWMPGPDHLDLFDGEWIPEPDTLFDDYTTRGTPARDQEMTIARHMYLHYDLQVPPTEAEGADLKGPDRAYERLLNRMTPKERAAWDAAYAPRNAAFREANLEGAELVRWKYQRYIKNYLRCIQSVDDNVGRVLDYLEANGLAENTIVIYSSDQGFYLGEHGWYDKRFMYEPSLRMPFIVRWPGVTDPGSRDTHLVQNLDFAETFLEIAGIEAPEEMQGESVVPLMRGEEPDDWRESIYYEYFEVGIHAVEPHYGVRTNRHKLMHFHRVDEWELYDIPNDPDEVHNLYGKPGMESLTTSLKVELSRLRDVYKVP